MAHLDIYVKNRQEAVDYALSIGATMPDDQFSVPGFTPDWTTLYDPAGHPFCLCDEQ